jgi:phage terminase large subunit-like protein
VLDDALKVKGGGWARRTVGVLVARQNGKSHLMRMRLLAGIFLWQEPWIAIAQNRGLALEQFEQAMALVESTPWLRQEVKKLIYTNGKEHIELKNGGKWSIAAATKGGTRGLTGNLWVDEGREITEEAWKAARPVTRAVRHSQTWVTSNAGDAYSTVLNNLRSKALESTSPTFGWYEYSADPKLDIMDRLAWRQANPALGHLIDFETIEEAAATDKPEAFRTETLCLWVQSMESPWTPGSVEAAGIPELPMSATAPTWLAVDFSPDRRRADLVACQKLDDDKVGLWLLAKWTSPNSVDEMTVARDVAMYARKFPTRVVAFDRYASAAVASRLSMQGIPVGDVSGMMFAQACDQMNGALDGGRVKHNGSPELVEHLLACARKPASDGGWRVIRRGSAGHISGAVAAIMAHHHAVAPQSAPQIIIGS